MDLQTLKNQYAQEQGYEDWRKLRMTIQLYSELETHMDIICIRAQKAKTVDVSDAEIWLGEKKDIWHHPYISDRNNTNAYELAELLTDFANYTKNLIR